MQNPNYSSSFSSSIKVSTYAWKLLVILSSIATMAMYAETMLIPAIPDIIKDFQVSYSMSSWILTAYLVTGAVTTPIAGKLSDIYGRKRVLLIIMIIYAVGVFIGGFATNIYFLLSVRAIQGIGMSVFPIAFGIIKRPISKREDIHWSRSNQFNVCSWCCNRFVYWRLHSSVFRLACNILHNNTYLHFTSDCNMAICSLR
jgi:hypothetical protein